MRVVEYKKLFFCNQPSAGSKINARVLCTVGAVAQLRGAMTDEYRTMVE
jgi:hypothetical protein